MKLHRIRVINLNSLYGEQQLDLDADLHGASLFLIRGPTGSGKSTLMDAVSLALFGTTPRLDGLRSEKDVAEQVMSRGTGVAIAELEFSMWSTHGDGRVRYRATWKARRGREKPDGKMQDTVRSIERLEADGSWSLQVGSHKAKDYAPVFAAVLEGFTPADFQRSMLLAQGQFDAMLHARPEERAAILERLTDTGDYQRLGERAARMWGAWRRRLEKRQSKRDAIAPLSGDDLAAAKQALSTADERMKALEADRARQQAGLDWLSRGVTLQADLTAAGEAVAAVGVRRAAAVDTLTALGAHEACAEAFDALDRSTEAQGELARHREAQRQLTETLPGLTEAVAGAEAALELARGSHGGASGALEALRGPATEATAAGSQQAQAHKEAEGARKALAAATQRHGEAQLALEGASADRTAAAEALGRAVEALGAQAGGEAAYQALSALQSQGTALRTQRESLARGRADVASRGEKLAASEGALSTAKAAHEAAWEATVRPKSEAATEAREALRSLTGAAEADDLAGELRRSIEAAQAHREALQRVQAALTEVTERRSDHSARVVSVREAEAAYQKAQEAQSEAVQGVEAAREGERLADARLAPLQRIADLGDRRKELTEGDACPLCGSGDHPFVHDPDQRAQAEAIQVEVDKAREALGAARTAREAADRAHTQAVSALSAAASRLEGARAEAQRAQDALTAAQERAREAMGSAGQFAELGPEALAAELGQADAQREALRQRLEQLEAARQRERGASDALVAADKAHAEEAHRLANEATRLAEAREQLAHRTEVLDADAAALAEGQEQLRAALLAVGIDAPATDDGLAQAQARALAWKQVHDAHAQAAVAHDKAEAAHRSATESLAQADRLRVEATASLAQREAALIEAQARASAAQRELGRVWAAAAALDGPGALPRPGVHRPPSELVVFQADRVASLHDAHEAARRGRDVALASHTQAVARQTTLAEAEVRLQAAATARAAALDTALQAASVPDAAVLAQRRLAPDALAAARALRERLTVDHTQAEARLQAVTEQLGRHQQARPTSLDDDATVASLTESLGSLAEARSEAQAQLDQARATIAMAERDRAALAAAQADLEADQRASALWEELNKLIGVGDGKRFKLFAQALNLDQLLVRANRHLEQLNERYHLSSVPDKDTGLPSLDFEVSDRWRPGTTRSLKTLSGGESFLVSLALALGLSDLRTSSMPVETLLLDEGFGTLDPATLDTALAALEQLQASGRQVGLISHVVGLQERIHARVLVEPLGEGRSRVLVE